MAEGKKKIKIAVVKQHKKPNDLWMVIEGKVYDVTKFRSEHPGGADTLDEHAGQDATQAFLDVGHSAEAREIMKKYYIGDLDTTDTKRMKQIGCAIGAFTLGIVVVFLIRKAMAK